jgi:hypothetical protein
MVIQVRHMHIMNYKVHRYKEAFVTLALLKLTFLVLVNNLLLGNLELITL